MSNPYNPRREVFDADKMLEAAMVGSDGVLDVDAILAKMVHGSGVSYRPNDEDLRRFWMLWQSPNGRRLMEWWLDMTIRAPCPHVGADLQSAAIAAAKFQARSSLGDVLLEALATGKRLCEQQA